MGKVKGFPQASHPDVVEVVVVDVEAARGARAPNNPELCLYRCPSATPEPETAFHLSPLPEFNLETRAFGSFSPDIGTKSCLDARCYDP